MFYYLAMYLHVLNHIHVPVFDNLDQKFPPFDYNTGNCVSLMFTKVCVICNPSQNIDNNIDNINNKRLFLFLTNLLLFRKILTALYLSLTKTKAGTDYIKLQRPQNMLLN